MALPELKSNILPDNEIITTHTQDGAEVISQLQQTPNEVESYVSAGNPVYTTHNVVPQVLTVLKENGQDITTVVEGFWDVVWSVNGQTGDVTIDAVAGNFIPNHTYRQNSIIVHDGHVYRAIADFTTKDEFDQEDWAEVSPRASLVFDLFQANHHYYAHQPIWQDGSIFVANVEFVSGTTFNPTDWTKASGGGTWGEIEGNLADQTDLMTTLNAKQNKTDIATSIVAGVTKLYTSKGTNTDGALTQKAAGDYYFPLSGGTLNDNAYIELLQWGQRKIKITGNNVTLDMSNVTGGWASTFAQMIDSVGTSYDMIGIYGGQSGLTHFYFGGTYSSPALKMTAADQVYTFKNRPYVGNVRLALESDTTALDARVTAVEGKIPAQATTSNQLADKAFVNSSVQTATANFRGNWENWASVPTDPTQYPADYAGSHTPTVNDYLVVQDASDYAVEELEGTWRFKYSGAWTTAGKNGWQPEYQVNETPMTAAQLAALNSGITAQTWSGINSAVSTNSADIADLDRDKVDKVTGKELSTNDYTTAEKNKLAGIEAGAEVNVQPDWNQTTTTHDAYIKNKPTKLSQFTNDPGFTTNTGTITAVQANGTSIATSGTANIPAASTGVYGVTKLSSATNSTSTSLAATPSAIKTTYDLANTKAKITVTDVDPGEGQPLSENNFIAVYGNLIDTFYPVGSVYISTTLSTAEQVQSAIGGIWQAWGAGRVPIGVDTTQTEFDSVGKTGGEKTHTLTIDEMPSHNHTKPSTNTLTGTYTLTDRWASGSTSSTSIATMASGDTGGGQAHNNLPPYITCYMYRRVA